MAIGDEEIRKAAELKAWLESRIRELEAELKRLNDTLEVLNAVLRAGSFKKASELAQKEAVEVRPLKRGDGKLLANAYISKDEVSIVPASEVKLSSSIPPFRSFFVNRVLNGMRSRDLELASKGALSEEEALSYEIDEDDFIRKITVRNYGNRSRLNDILSSLTWSFTKMLEKLPESHG